MFNVKGISITNTGELMMTHLLLTELLKKNPTRKENYRSARNKIIG
jgi:hypothetical protein